MPTDRYGLPVTTASPDALAAYDRAAHGLLAWKAETLDAFRAAAARDPGLALAHAGASVCHFLEERFAEARAAGEAARAAAAGQTERERSHVEALALWTGGRTDDAERAMRAHLGAWPRDAVVLQRLYFVWFWQGRFPEMLELTTALRAQYPGDSFVLGLHAFAVEEAGRCAEAQRLAEEALALNADDAWSVHALAHALYEDARFEPGIARLPPATDACRDLNWFRNHLVWHLALMHFARGEYERASEISRATFEPRPSSIAGDLHDSISLLWRLELAGRPVGARWQPFTAIARERLTRMGLYFHVAHVAMALGAGGDHASAARQADLLRERTAKDRTGLMGDVLLPLVEGLHAFAAGDHARTIARLEPLAPRLVELGGSRAQRDVFHDTLLEACFRAGDMARAARLVQARIERRPDRLWLDRAGGDGRQGGY
jgi:tetratricopeptide (TPR) repeat protein